MVEYGLLVALIAVVGAYAGYTLYRIDHDVHHVGVPASLLAKVKSLPEVGAAGGTGPGLSDAST